MTVYELPHAFEEFPLAALKERVKPDALALVRDDEVWSQLVPSNDPTREQFALWRFHFPAGADNSGFVGWLASRLKLKFGTGVFVVCGQNSGDGGIFDYWGAPWSLHGRVINEIKSLVGSR